jgi:hypothetical protein
MLIQRTPLETVPVPRRTVVLSEFWFAGKARLTATSKTGHQRACGLDPLHSHSAFAGDLRADRAGR